MSFVLSLAMAFSIMSCDDDDESKDDKGGAGDGLEWVDLGLPSGTLWASCNLGAKRPEEFGSYFAWGETSPKANYTWETYLSGLGGTMMQAEDTGTDKDPLKEYVYGGANYSEGIGGTAYDAATVALGTGYRMPTQKEFEELANEDYCSWVWYDKDNAEFNGVAGYKITTKKIGYTDRYIFLPAAGVCNEEFLYYEGSLGVYWSSTPSPYYAEDACRLYFLSDNVNPDNRDWRFSGFSMRPVKEKVR